MDKELDEEIYLVMNEVSIAHNGASFIIDAKDISRIKGVSLEEAILFLEEHGVEIETIMRNSAWEYIDEFLD